KIVWSHFRSGDFLRLDRDLVVTRFLVAIAHQALSLRRFFQRERRSTLRTLLGNRLVPHNEIAVGIFQTAIEDLASFGTALNQLPPTSRSGAWNADQFRFDVFAFRIIATRNEFAKPSLFENHFRLTALRTDFIQNDVRLLGRFCTRGKFASGLALRIARAGEKLAEPSAF